MREPFPVFTCCRWLNLVSHMADAFAPSWTQRFERKFGAMGIGRLRLRQSDHKDAVSICRIGEGAVDVFRQIYLAIIWADIPIVFEQISTMLTWSAFFAVNRYALGLNCDG